MRVRLAGRYVTFVAETDTERSDLELIAGDIARQQFKVDSVNGEGVSLRAMGPAKEPTAPAKREGKATALLGRGEVAVGANAGGEINITFDTVEMPLQLISNLAHTPFVLDGHTYASIEGFWQGLKFEGDGERRRLAALWGHDAKLAGPKSKPGDRIVYRERQVVVGTIEHWELMEAACRAKFTQHEGARSALISTHSRPLVHRVPVDSRTIPGIIMGDIWMRIRAEIKGI